MAVLLEEMFAADSVRASHDGKRPAGQSRQGIGGGRLPVFREVELGDAGPKLFIWMGQLNVTDDSVRVSGALLPPRSGPAT